MCQSKREMAIDKLSELREMVEILKDANAELGETIQGLNIQNSEMKVRSNAVTNHIKWLQDNIDKLNCESSIGGTGACIAYNRALENIKKEAME